MRRLLQYIVSVGSRCIYKFTVLFCLLAVASTARGQLAKQADAYFEAEQYHVASEMYSNILASDSANYRAALRLALCQRELFDYEEAGKHFEYVAREAAINFPISIFYYAEFLKRKQDFKLAIEWYDKYLALTEKQRDAELSKLAQYEREGCIEALLVSTGQSSNLSLERLPEPVNTSFQEFAPSIYGHDSVLIFSSSRLQAEGPLSNRSGQRFTDQFLALRDSSTWMQDTQYERFDRLNSEVSEASGSFTGDASLYYFTRCGERSGNCQIYVSKKLNGRWQAPRLLPPAINQPGSSSKHPFITSSGDSLFFVTDRQGGMGQSDIWLSTADSLGQWQQAVNLGVAVNSTQDEVFPFYYAPEKLLIFGSEGRDGPGGMDLYMIGLGTALNSTAIPLEAPFNSTYDDCCLVFGSQQGYVSSNREGSFDIYTFAKDRQMRLGQLLIGIPSLEAAQLRNGSPGRAFDDIITDYSFFLDDEMEYLSVMHSDRQHFLSNGSSRFVLSADVNDIMLEQLRDQQALAQREENPAQPRLSDTTSSQRVLASISTRDISQDERAEIRGKVRYAENFQEVSAMRLYLLNQQGEVIKITTTNRQGSFRFINLQAASSYQIVNAEESGDQEYLFSYDISGYGNEVNTLKFDNIYFDFNQASLRNEAEVALNELVSYYRQNPGSVIEINAFTDTTGNDIYNLKLSRERGTATFNYLLEAGVDRSSLVINARGASTAVASSNSFVSQQLNRRVELYITGSGLAYESEVVTRMLRPEVTLSSLSGRTGMSIDDIRRLNGITGNTLKAYKPVRLYEWAAQRAPALFYQMTVRSEE